jgi:hypothetical protein
MHPMRWQQPSLPPPPYRYIEGAGANEGMQWPYSIPGHHGVAPTDHMRMPNVFSPAPTCETTATGQAAAAIGCGSVADGGPGDDETAGFEDEGEDLHNAQDAWQRLLENIRGPDEPAVEQGGRKRHRGEPDDDEGSHGNVVEIQSADRVFLPQGHRETCTSLWIVNSADWIDVEHVLRRMLRCEASECHAFHSIGYVFFRSCAISHIAAPSDFLKDGTFYRFPNTEVVVSIARAHEEGVLQVECYLEYRP